MYWLKKNKLIYFIAFLVQEFRSSLAGQFRLKSLMKLQSRCRSRRQSTEGLTGAGTFTLNMAHSSGQQAGSSCWQKALIPFQVDISQGCLSILTVQQLASFSTGNSRESKQKAAVSFMTQSSSFHIITSAGFYQSHRPALIQCRSRLCKDVNTRSRVYLGSPLRLATTVNVCFVFCLFTDPIFVWRTPSSSEGEVHKVGLANWNTPHPWQSGQRDM